MPRKPREAGADASRVLSRLEELYAIGGGEGANRLGLSREEQRALELAADWMQEAGLDLAWDAAGNLFGRLPGERGSLPEVWTGSHLDTVPRGGRFDGALGVVAGIEALERLSGQERGPTLVVVAFRDEEGARFGRGFFGSRALAGRLEPGELETRDSAGTSVREALAELGLGPPPLGGWLGSGPAAFVELHIEQGPVLERRGLPLGIATGIAAMARFTRHFRGTAGHAGTTPMVGREDALCRAAEYVLRVRDAALAVEGAVGTVGAVRVQPGAVNVIPDAVDVEVDVRAPDSARLDALLRSIDAAGTPVRDAAAMTGPPLAAVRAAVEEAGVPPVELLSGAGHDVGVLAQAGVPSALLFVRSLAGGVSHSPLEHASADDVALGVHALTVALRLLSAR